MQANPKERMNRAYIDNKLSIIFEPLVNQIVQDKPTSIVTKIDSYLILLKTEFMVTYLKDQYGNRPSSKSHRSLIYLDDANERLELEYLRKEVPKLRE
jgi:hypothetical protein